MAAASESSLRPGSQSKRQPIPRYFLESEQSAFREREGSLYVRAWDRARDRVGTEIAGTSPDDGCTREPPAIERDSSLGGEQVKRVREGPAVWSCPEIKLKSEIPVAMCVNAK